MKFEPGAKLGPYQILGELGRGGMATVYRAYQPSLEREVAIKILPEFLVEQPGFKARFHREAVAVARLQHPNILSVFDHGEQDGVTYIVSEYVEGGTLASRMGAPIQLDYCVRILRPIADALDYAHSEGVIHRDVKPSNILLDRRGVPILSDFGLARVSEEGERLTQTGAMVGTPTYMAPEQCTGGEVGPSADIYALAIIAYEMATGRVPFTGSNPLSVIAAQQTAPPPPPRKFNPSLPASIEQPLLTGLAKDPARRPETATDFVESLAAALPGMASQYPLTPPPATTPPPTPTAIAPPSYPQASAAQPYPSPAPYATAAATPPPTTYPPVQAQPQQQYTPAPVYPAAPQQWVAPAPARREGAPGWVVIALWIGFAVAVATTLGAIIAPFGGSLDDTARGVWAALGVVSAIAGTLSLASALGLAARDRWAPAVGWGSVASLAASVVASPVAIAVAVGLARAPRGTLVAPQPRAGSSTRVGVPLAGGALVLLVLTTTTVVAWNQRSAGPGVAQSTPSPTACRIFTPDAPMTAQAIGSSCGFAVASTAVQLNCKSVTALPGPLVAASYDDNKSAFGGGGTLSMDSAGCHLIAPAYQIESDIKSTANLDAGPLLIAMDFQPPDAGQDAVIGFLFGCDAPGCVQYDFYPAGPDVEIYQDGDDQPLISKKQSPMLGTNRLVAVLQGQQLRVWFNGTLVDTSQIARAHGAGDYRFYLESFDKAAPVSATVLSLGVYRLQQ